MDYGPHKPRCPPWLFSPAAALRPGLQEGCGLGKQSVGTCVRRAWKRLALLSFFFVRDLAKISFSLSSRQIVFKGPPLKPERRKPRAWSGHPCFPLQSLQSQPRLPGLPLPSGLPLEGQRDGETAGLQSPSASDPGAWEWGWGQYCADPFRA